MTDQTDEIREAVREAHDEVLDALDPAPPRMEFGLVPQRALSLDEITELLCLLSITISRQVYESIGPDFKAQFVPIEGPTVRVTPLPPGAFES